VGWTRIRTTRDGADVTVREGLNKGPDASLVAGPVDPADRPAADKKPAISGGQSVIRKSGDRFSEKIMLHPKCQSDNCPV
jgi:hypothetical protein